MAKSVQSVEVDEVVRSHLKAQGCALSPHKGNGETGVDIKATLGDRSWLVEVIGFQDRPPMRSKEFYEAFFRVISRDTDNLEDALVLALPARFKRGMRQRMNQYGTAWEKLGKAFPNLQIWYVETEKGIVEEHSWSEPVD